MFLTQRNTPGEESFIERKPAFIGKGKGLSIGLSTDER